MGNTSVPMPAQATCCQCHKSRPVKAQMNFEDRSIPLLVVPQDVSSIEEALAAATCQVCLSRKGSVDRGLYQILKNLGAEDLDCTTPVVARGAIVASRDEQPSRERGAVVIQRGQPQEVVIVDPLVGTSLVRPVRERSGHDHRGSPHRGHGWNPAPSEPRLPDVLRDPEPVREPEPPVEHLTGAIGQSGGNAAVLEAAKGVIRQRDEAKRRERAQKFDSLMFWLKLTLARIRKQAAQREIWNLVEAFQRKLGEVSYLDLEQRGKRRLLEQLGTSEDEIQSLCLRIYERQSNWRRSQETVCETIDAFEGGRRPEHWNIESGRKPAFYELEVVRTKSNLPIPNSPLSGGDEGSNPRIGVVCQVIARRFYGWLASARKDLGIGTEFKRVDLPALLQSFFAQLKQALADEQTHESFAQVEESTTISAELSSNT